MTKPQLTPEDLRSIFLNLQTANLDAVVVGGQAVNLWASKYCNRSPELRELLPFASEDLDFYGGKLEVIQCRDALDGDAKLNRDFDPSPNSGLVLVKHQGLNLRIDFLAAVYGLNDTEISATAISFSGQQQLAGIEIKILHPVLCLEGKLRSLRGLPQQGRQDLKHVQMSVLCVREFLCDVCVQSDPRTGLKLVERVLDNATREDGLSAWYHHGICIESAIPLSNITAQADSKWQIFIERRLPQVMNQITTKRHKYLELMNRIAAINQQQAPQLVEKSSQHQLGQSEALEIAGCVQALLSHLGEIQPDNSISFESKNFFFIQQQDVVSITAKQDNREVLRVEGAVVIVFNATANERHRLKNFCEQIQNDFQDQQQQQQQQFRKGRSL